MHFIKIIITTFTILLLFACQSNNKFVINSLSDTEKSEILTEKGINYYNIELISKENLAAIDKSKEYFIRALKLNPDNTTAKNYLKKVNSYKDKLIKKYIANSMIYKNKSQPGNQDKFNMCYYLQKALSIDPKNQEAKELKRSVSDTYNQLIEYYIEKGDEIKEKLKNAKEGSKKNLLLLDGIDKYGRAVLLDPDNIKAKNSKKVFEDQIIEKMKANIAGINQKISKQQYTSALKDIKQLYQFSYRIDNKYFHEIKDLEYNIYLEWAKNYYSKDRLDMALSKLNSAQKIKSTREISSLKQKIETKQITLRAEQSFENVLEEIDELIAERELLYAKNKTSENLTIIKDSAKIEQLKIRKNKIEEQIPALYAEAISDFNEENFKNSIKKFEIIKTLQPGYKETDNYYNKAVEKQKILDSF